MRLGIKRTLYLKFWRKEVGGAKCGIGNRFRVRCRLDFTVGATWTRTELEFGKDLHWYTGTRSPVYKKTFQSVKSLLHSLIQTQVVSVG